MAYGGKVIIGFEVDYLLRRGIDPRYRQTHLSQKDVDVPTSTPVSINYGSQALPLPILQPVG